MIVEEIQFEGFFLSTDPITIKLPPTGIVLVTGPNGAGKSAIVVEAVATACWGKTWRGTPPWNDEHGGGWVRVSTPDLEIQRAAKGQKLLWNEHGQQPARYDTPTKAQQALADVLGTFDTWRRTSVFSSQDAAHFSLATDKERKILLETILGLERFDPALKQCRKDLADSAAILRAREAKIAVLQERISGLRARLEDLEETEESEDAVCATPLSETAKAQIEKEVQLLSEERVKLETERSDSRTAGGHLSAQVEHAERDCKRLDRDSCPTCDQPIPSGLRDELRVNAKKARTKLREHERAVEDASKARDARIGELSEKVEALRQQLRDSAQAERDIARVAANAEQRSNKRIVLVDELKKARVDLTKAQEDARVMRIEVAELEAVESVLGLKGVRAHILGGAMEAITALANGWLARLFPGVSIALHEAHDKVELEVLGLPHKYGYRGSSSGQRRRVDIALLLALSDLEAASRGVPLGTLMLDEVADTLDTEDGLLSFTSVIQEVSEERCVVIISHNPALMESLGPRKRLHVQKDGTVLELKAA